MRTTCGRCLPTLLRIRICRDIFCREFLPSNACERGRKWVAGPTETGRRLQHRPHPRKEREDGAPFAEMVQAETIEGGPPALSDVPLQASVGQECPTHTACVTSIHSVMLPRHEIH